MGRYPGLFFLFFCVQTCLSYLTYKDGERPTINWPTEYYLKGEEINMKNGIVAPFEMWYSENLNRSRRDYYGGVEKKYYFNPGENENFTVYHLFPMTNEVYDNVIQCVEEVATVSQFLPSLKILNYVGDENFEGKMAQKWSIKSLKMGNSTVEMTVYTYKVGEDDIPLRISSKQYNNVNYQLSAHKVTNYYGFKDEFDETVVDVEWEGVVCDNEVTFWERYDFENLDSNRETHAHFAFKRFTEQHNKFYDEHEYKVRKEIFHDTWKYVTEHNNKDLGYKLEVNKYADWSDEELGFLTGVLPSTKDFGATPFPYNEEELMEVAPDLPEKWDLRQLGVLRRVKDQGVCGSCWAFSTVASVEGALALANGGRNLDLSEQSLVDCAWGFQNAGCDGGMLDGGLKYVLEHGVPTDMEYGPYIQKNGYCQNKNMTKMYHIQGFGKITPRNSISLKLALKRYGPVVAGVYAAKNMFLYSNGLYADSSCEDGSVNHAVTIVGYGERDNTTYWMVKNSWGEDWGLDGYILVSSEEDCYLSNAGYYPII